MTETRPENPRLALPPAPQPAAPFRFPVVAATVPIVASLAIWLITGSSFALIFAALGPLAATGSYVDSRVSARKKLRAETARFANDVALMVVAIDAHHTREMTELVEHTPPAVVVVRDVHKDSSRWMREPHDVIPVHIGYGSVRSNLALDATGAHDRTDDRTGEQYQLLTERAATLHGAPIAVNSRLGIAIFGNEKIALSLARAMTIQLARTLSPETTWVRFQGALSAELWATRLPHRLLHSGGGGSSSHGQSNISWGRLGDDSASVSLSVVSHEEQVPSGHRIIIRAGGEGIAVVGHPDKHQRREFEPSFLGREQALVWSIAAHEIAARDGLSTSEGVVPDSVEFGDLFSQLAPPSETKLPRSHTLASTPAIGASGSTVIDLVTNGPHAVVGGTTGSGKSELLISWVLAMAAESSPADVTFLLVDFKGGSAFTALDELPHTVGIITDLNETEASRAFASLRAELRYRERELAEAAARDVSELDTLPRLVIVVDEFAAMMADYPQLHALFSDIAARGRSLGVHLILCTQRPSGVVRDSLLANADLRISLRVNNGADSSAVIGSDRAAELPAQAKGRAWVAYGSSSAELVQFALASTDDIGAVAGRWPVTDRPRRPWCEPLAEHIALDEVGQFVRKVSLRHESLNSNRQGKSITRNASERPNREVIRFGLSDLPDEQRHGVAEWSISSEGNLFILGAPSSGKSTAIAAIVTAAIAAMPATQTEHELTVATGGLEPAGFWDALARVHTSLDHIEVHTTQSRRTLLVVDDLDAVLSRFNDDYRSTVVDRLSRLLREGPARNIWVIATAQRITPALQSLVQLVPNMLRLRCGSRQDFVLSGGATADYIPALPPGGGLWKGARIQIGVSDGYPPVSLPSVATRLSGTESLVVASGYPAAASAALTSAGWQVRTLSGAPGTERELLITDARRPIAVVGSIDEWQSRWGALTLMRSYATTVLDGCTLSDYRQLTRSRELPPPLTPGLGHYWRLTEDGVDRVLLPS